MTAETRESLRTLSRELESLASTLKTGGRNETAFILNVAKMAIDEELYGVGGGILIPFAGMRTTSATA